MAVDVLELYLADIRRLFNSMDPAPFHERDERMNLLVFASEIHQCFGIFTGWVLDDSGSRIPVDGLVGWAEEARNRW